MENVENNERYPINFTIFKSIFDDENINLNDLIKEYNSNIYESELKLKEK